MSEIVLGPLQALQLAGKGIIRDKMENLVQHDLAGAGPKLLESDSRQFLLSTFKHSTLWGKKFPGVIQFQAHKEA